MTETLLPHVDTHLVVKRGHRGRFRFVLISGCEKIGGEVHIGDADRADDADLRSIAMNRITRLASALLDGLAGEANVEPSCTPADRSARLSDVRREVRIGAGG